MLTLNRTRFLGHMVMLRGHGYGGKFVLAAEGHGKRPASPTLLT